MIKRLIGVLGAVLLGAALTSSAGTAGAATAPPAANFAGTLDLHGCSGSLVRTENSADTDKAFVLTNGHCFGGTWPIPDEVLINQPTNKYFNLLDSTGHRVASLQASKALYVSMTGTDVTLFQVDNTYARLERQYHVRALELSSTRPVPGTDITVISGGLQQTYSCKIDTFAYRVLEATYVTKDVIRYTPSCNTGAGTSGSPIVDEASGKVVGINNTSNRAGGRCTEDSPCEMDREGTITVHKGIGYGTQTYWITTCVAPGNRLDLHLPACLLPKPA
jgi:hypothetical protein